MEDDDDDEYKSKLDLQLKPVFYSNFSRLAPFSYMNPFANALSGLTHVSPSLPLGVREKLLSTTFKAGSFQAMCFAKALLAGKDGWRTRSLRRRRKVRSRQSVASAPGQTAKRLDVLDRHVERFS